MKNVKVLILNTVHIKGYLLYFPLTICGWKKNAFLTIDKTKEIQWILFLLYLLCLFYTIILTLPITKNNLGNKKKFIN